ncbi:hypothetical protein FRC08_007305, partial [Ceratobasidium sp. 394]
MEIPISNTPSTTVPKSSEYRQRMKLTVLYKFARLMARIHSVIEGALPHHLITSLILYSPHDMSRYGPTDIDPCTPFRFRGRARNRPSFSMPQTMSAEHYLILFFRALHGSGVPYLDGRGWWGAVEGHGATFLRVRLYRGVRYTPSPQVQSSLTLSDCSSIVYNLATTPGVEANLFIQIRHSKRTTRRFFWIHPLT